MFLQRRTAPRPSVPQSVIDASKDIKADITDRLFVLLSDIQYSGSFLTAQSSQSGVLPGLHIPNIGQIRLPLSPDDAKAIIQSCHASPFGKGTETLVDNSVRKSWELNTDQFSIRNPSWKDEVNRLVALATEGLGLFARPADIVAEPYKLLLYEEGAFFLPHQDSPKADGMFGTLVICLPSQHTGGDLVATHKGGREVFETSLSSEFGFSSAAWYSDVTHEVKPVTSGYRLVLTYNLIHRPTAALLNIRDNASAKIASVFDYWEKICKESYQKFTDTPDWLTTSFCPSSLLFMLDHEYHSAGISFAQLKDVDQMKVLELRRACEEKGFYLYLANVTKTVMGGCDEDSSFYAARTSNGRRYHSIVDELENSISLSSVVDCDGHVVADSVGVCDELFIQEDIFKDHPDEEDFSGFTGNEGTSATHFYRQTAALIIPPTFLAAFVVHALRDGKVDLKTVIADKVNVKNYMPKAEYPDLLAPCLLHIGELTLFKELVGRQPTGFGCSTGQSIGKAIQGHGLSSISPSLDIIFKSGDRTMNKLELLSNIVSEYLKHSGESEIDLSNQIMAWHDATLDHILSHPQKLIQKDGSKLVLLIESYPTGNMLERVLLLIEKGISESAFIVSFLTSLYGASEEGKLEKTEMSKIFNFALPKFLEVLHLERPPQDPGNVRSQSYRMGLAPRISPSRPDPFSPQNLITLIKQCDALSIEKGTVLDALSKCSSTLPKDEVEDVFENVLLPFLHHLCLYIHELSKDRSLETAERQFVSQTIKSYFGQHVKAKPQAPADWARDLRISCRCDDCRKLLHFARDPHMERERFPVAKERRFHLHCQLDGTGFKKETTRNGSPHTLHVWKTNLAFDNSSRRWKENLQIARSWLAKFVEQSHLIEIIGNESYQELQQLAQTGVPASVLTSTTAQSLNADASVTTVSKKRSFVDLT